MIRIPHLPTYLPTLITLALLTIGLIGCDTGGNGNVVGYNPDDNLTQGNTNQSVHPVLDTENNRLVFKDQEHFANFMQEMSGVHSTYDKLDGLESELGLRSLRGHINDLRESLDKSSVEDSLAYFAEYNKIETLDIVEDPLFATVLNVRGEIQIGKIIHKIGKFFVYSVDKDYEHLLREIDNNGNNDIEFKENEHIDVFRIKRQSELSGLSKDASMASSTCQNRYNGNRYRVNGRSWITTYGMYGSAGTQTHHYKRINIFGTYRLRSVHKISVTMTVQLYNQGNYYSHTNYTVTNYNVSAIIFTFAPGNIPNGGIHGYIDAHHHIERADDGSTAGCSTYVSRSAS